MTGSTSGSIAREIGSSTAWTNGATASTGIWTPARHAPRRRATSAPRSGSIAAGTGQTGTSTTAVPARSVRSTGAVTALSDAGTAPDLESKLGAMAEPDPPDDTPTTDTSRLQLLWDVLVFQFKLAADGLRDVLLSPVSLISAIMGLVAGGDEPDRYFKQVLRLGRRSEIWINLFGYRKHGATSDQLIEPLKDKVFNEARSHPLVNRVGGELNRTLDNVNASLQTRPGRDQQEP